jgi:hypothetical protein
MRKIPMNVSSIICSLQPFQAMWETNQSTGFQRTTSEFFCNPILITAVNPGTFTK